MEEEGAAEARQRRGARNCALGIARSELRAEYLRRVLRTFGFVSAEMSTTPRVSVSSARHLRTWSERPSSATEPSRSK